MATTKYQTSLAIQTALGVLGRAIALRRKQKHWRQVDLASRLGAARQTVAKIEQGDDGVNIGLYYMALWLLDIPLIPGLPAENKQSIHTLSQLVALINQDQPTRIKLTTEKPIDDNF